MIKKLLAELKSELTKIFRERLKGVYLFGSYARGDQDNESDVDVMIVLDDYVHYASELGRIDGLNSDLSLRYGVSISTIFMRERDWLEGKTPLLRNVREEAIPA